MRRVVSTASSVRNATWFSCTPSSSCVAPPAMRASSVSARAGMIASSSCVEPARSVSLTASLYESVAAITSLPGSKRARIPVSTGTRLVARGRARDLRDRLEQRLRVDVEDLRVVDLRQARKVLRAVRVQADSSPCRRRRSARLPRRDARAAPPRRAAAAQGRPAGGRARRPSLRLRPAPRATCAATAPCRSQRGRELPSDALQQNAGEDLHGAPRRNRPGNDPEPGDELLRDCT